jgi:hypothetical protein
MFRKRTSKHEAGPVASGARAARRMTAQVRPMARTTGAAAARRVRRTRAWAAPQVERAGQVLQDDVAPKVSALLSSAARRVEPGRASRRRWPRLVGGSAFTAAVGAMAAVVRNRMKPSRETSADAADGDDVTPAAQMPDGQARTSADAEAEQPSHTS